MCPMSVFCSVEGIKESYKGLVINKLALIWGGTAGAVFYLDTVCNNHTAGRKQYSSGKNTGSSNLEMLFFCI
ncbi:hypothetical protein CMV_030570 [Castanea mollissima]|uniref:Uncharacterized protein n=1 Tax=Castanea mollissima TaxID=60419 RepID=A0A8J4V694_9ROSI|nr:hypothetical protein CMV_030570 [Castanea mollissima]